MQWFVENSGPDEQDLFFIIEVFVSEISENLLKNEYILYVMKEEVALYKFESESLKVEITARFEGGDLVVEGYDIGKVVAEALS